MKRKALVQKLIRDSLKVLTKNYSIFILKSRIKIDGSQKLWARLTLQLDLIVFPSKENHCVTRLSISIENLSLSAARPLIMSISVWLSRVEVVRAFSMWESTKLWGSQAYLLKMWCLLLLGVWLGLLFAAKCSRIASSVLSKRILVIYFRIYLSRTKMMSKTPTKRLIVSWRFLKNTIFWSPVSLTHLKISWKILSLSKNSLK